MCGGCRKVFEKAGVPGLRERVRVGEMGGYWSLASDHDALILHVVFLSSSLFQVSYVSFPFRLIASVQDASGHPIAWFPFFYGTRIPAQVLRLKRRHTGLWTDYKSMLAGPAARGIFRVVYH
jgi:hypothetical protein